MLAARGSYLWWQCWSSADDVGRNRRRYAAYLKCEFRLLNVRGLRNSQYARLQSRMPNSRAVIPRLRSYAIEIKSLETNGVFPEVSHA